MLLECIKLMKTSIAKQPISLGIAANNRYIHSYKSGVIDDFGCSTGHLVDKEFLTTINHGVLLVGYGHDEVTGFDYFLVKNSWNTTWGDQGYVKFKIWTYPEDTFYYGIMTCTADFDHKNHYTYSYPVLK